MGILLTILFMAIVGAIIGGFTNHLAIKMLFHPYKAIYVGKWKLPFTPGLIPKRRDELANQMGKMVVEHLLTPESIKRKFLNEGFQSEITSILQAESARLLKTDKTLREQLTFFGVDDVQVKLEKELNQVIETKYESLMAHYRGQPIKNVLSPGILKKIDSKIPEISSYIIQKGVDYFSSVEGEIKVQRMIDDFIKQRNGMLGNMLQMFLGNVNLADKIQPEILKFLNSGGTNELVTTLIKKEADKVLEWDVEKIEEQIGKDQVLKMVKDSGHKIIKVDRFLDTPLSELTAPFQDGIIEKFVPNGVRMMGEWLSNKMDMVMEKLRLAEIVREQVETFSVERLEDMILSITKSELKMITYLGALLGGIIGVFQGLIAIMIS